MGTYFNVDYYFRSMKVCTVNIGEKRTVIWRDKEYCTGIFKEPINRPIQLGKMDVVHDHVIDRKYHGGVNKACYLFSADHYDHFKNIYPNLKWNNGMFGENLTIMNFDEKQVYIGDTFKVGTAIIQISEPRLPCSTLAMRFDAHRIMKDFIEFGRCGAYVRVLEEGYISAGDIFELIEHPNDSFSVFDVFFSCHNSIEPNLRDRMLNSTLITENTKKELLKKG